MVALYLGWTKRQESKEKERGEKKMEQKGGCGVCLNIRAVLREAEESASSKFHREVDLWALNSVLNSMKVQGHFISLLLRCLQV